MSNKRNHGFTLIELLVVIAIIAILAAILFPVFARARSHARSTKCLSNLKQMGESFLMYRNDYDGIFPLPGVTQNTVPIESNKDKWRTFINDLQPYTKNEDIFFCPETNENPKIWKANPAIGNDWDTYTGSAIFRFQYAVNKNLLQQPASKIEYAAEVVLVYDSRQAVKADENINNGVEIGDGNWQISKYGCFEGYAPKISNQYKEWRYLGKRHSDGINVAYADGHTEYKKDLIKSYWLLTPPQ